jgi:hypothetical protein
MAVRLWIESGAPYAGTYAALGTGMVKVGPVQGGVYRNRCVRCHRRKALGHVELLYNLTDPERSLVLMAPLAKKAGGLGLCGSGAGSQPVFADTRDPDYRRVFGQIMRASERLTAIKRFDMPGFKPSPHYVREMKRYGILPNSFDVTRDPLNVYETDQTYWKSFWQ